MATTMTTTMVADGGCDGDGDGDVDDGGDAGHGDVDDGGDVGDADVDDAAVDVPCYEPEYYVCFFVTCSSTRRQGFGGLAHNPSMRFCGQ